MGTVFPLDDAVRVWSRRLVVLGVLALAAFLAPRASLVQLAGLAGALGGVLVLRSPGLGVAGLVFAALVVPFGLSTGTETELNIAVIVVIGLTGLWFAERFLRRDIQIERSRLLAAMCAFAVACALAFLVGLQTWLPMARTAPLFTQLGGLAIYVLSMCAFLLGAYRLRDERWLKVVVVLVLCLGAVYMLRRLAVDLPIPRLVPQDGAADGSLFWLWVGTLSFSQALLNRKLPLAWRAAAMVLFGLTLYVGLDNKDWNSGWTPVLVSALIILVLGAPRLSIPVLIAGAAYVALKLPELMQSYVLNDYKQYDLLTRTAAWDILMQIIRIEPVFGVGFGNYYWYTPLYSILGYNVSFNSHNNYVDLAAQTGAIGCLCFAWLTLEIGILAWRLRHAVPEGFPRAYVYGAIGGLVGSLVSAFLGDWLLPFVYNVGMAGFRSSILSWVLLGALVLLHKRYSSRQVLVRESDQRLSVDDHVEVAFG